MQKAPPVEEPGTGLVEVDDDVDGGPLRLLLNGRASGAVGCVLTQERTPKSRDLDPLAIHVDDEVLLRQACYGVAAPARHHDVDEYLGHGHRVRKGLRGRRLRQHARRETQYDSQEQAPCQPSWVAQAST